MNEKIANILVETFAKVSSSGNYDPSFLDIKREHERSPPNFGHSSEPYNQNFTIDEMKYVISKTKDTSPGEDGIHYRMIKNMPEIALKYMLRMINSFFTDSYFPNEWNTSIIVPILKPGKDPALPTS